MGLCANLLVLVLISLSGKSVLVRFLNGLLLATNITILALIFGLLEVLSMPDWFPGSVPVALALLGGALAASIPALVWWLSNRVANPAKRRALKWSGAAIVANAIGAMSVRRQG